MDSRAAISPDEICNNVIRSRMAVYTAREEFEHQLREYNRSVDSLLSLVAALRQHIHGVDSKQTTPRENGQA